MALRARLRREAARQERDERNDARRQTIARFEHRREQVRVGMERLIWNEVEAPENERLAQLVEEYLEEEILYDNFLEETVEAHIDRLRALLGLKPQVAEAKPAPQPTYENST